ncbi:DUF4295 family protein [Candidatus Walczuchella monophlebidarum]|uniref:DUF4295 domain-containing protein n=1 Tax=Candidatus Walczuchella monophlebidarum TaxID=1415657 RepID=A0A068DNJ0_9FLAO|nr:DUF4295 family protein [Candidatus Walczuchella monophlebidarum]AID37330.1 hypothetical protein FNIIJ_025 [Candidatus Walczuchella monophlebidarum]
MAKTKKPPGFQNNGSKKMTKVIRMIKSIKSRTYVFEEKIVPDNKINDFFSTK